jgi:hypothetical protein
LAGYKEQAPHQTLFADPEEKEKEKKLLLLLLRDK